MINFQYLLYTVSKITQSLTFDLAPHQNPLMWL